MLKPSKKVGIITIHAKSLTREHLAATGVDKIPYIIMGTESEKEFSRAILDDEMELDVAQSQKDLIRVAKRMKEDHPEVGAIVLECTNMPPFASAMQKEIGLPIFDIFTLVHMVYQSVARKEFCGFM
jgi:Asp/Glu/hydantoin racemase